MEDAATVERLNVYYNDDLDYVKTWIASIFAFALDAGLAAADSPPVHAGARYPKRGADTGGQTGRRRQRHHGVRQGASFLDVGGMPSKAATFF